MKCPHCEYKNGWGWWPDDQGNESYSNNEGDFGSFYEQTSKFTRTIAAFNTEEVKCYACPCCCKTFIAHHE